MKGRQSSKLRLEEHNPLFLASQQKQIAGELVDDSDIRNCNNNKAHQMEVRGALDIWNFAKKVGLSAGGKQEVCLQQLAKMEIRDKMMRKKQGSKGDKSIVKEGNLHSQ
ncbi:hypothetical protein SLA2020_120380 [Shorea laevis]